MPSRSRASATSPLVGGIPQYWVVDRDGAQTVTLHRLAGQGGYEERARMPLAWLLQTSPAEHLD